MIHAEQGNSSYRLKSNHSFRLLCNSSYMERLSERIARLRIEKQLSQRAVGGACGVSHVAVGKWESGQTENIKLANLLALARLFGMSASELLQEPSLGVAYTSTPVQVAQQRDEYNVITDDEQLILTAYRMADETGRSLLLAQARTLNAIRARSTSANAA
jgi:transcriptional regulator with XRE-family HTH domain